MDQEADTERPVFLVSACMAWGGQPWALKKVYFLYSVQSLRPLKSADILLGWRCVDGQGSQTGSKLEGNEAKLVQVGHSPQWAANTRVSEVALPHFFLQDKKKVFKGKRLDHWSLQQTFTMGFCLATWFLDSQTSCPPLSALCNWSRRSQVAQDSKTPDWLQVR